MSRVGPPTLEEPDFDYAPFILNPTLPQATNPRTGLNFKWLQDRHTRGAYGRDLKYQLFMLRRLWFESDENEDAQWGPVRLLGAGTYGHVGLWQKRNSSNEPIDELALKEGLVRNFQSTEVDWQLYPRLLKEAVIQRDINCKDPRVAPHLRRYKFISEQSDNSVGRYRSYVEFCPHDTLDRLGKLYRAWDQYLPEVFLWRIFHEFAIAGEALRDNLPDDSLAWDESVPYDLRSNGSCVHFDLKPSNILLDHALEGAHEADFPRTKLSDFGLSVYTDLNDTNNPCNLWWRRTKVFAPPEQTQYGAHWAIPPTGAVVRTHNEHGQRLDCREAKRLQKAQNKLEGQQDMIFSHANNIYGFGATMYAVTTLRTDRHLSNIAAKTLQKYQRNGNHQISHVNTKTPGIYSSRLRRLIHRCLDPNPANRPSQLELFDQTSRGLRLAERRVRKARRAMQPATGPYGRPPAPLPSERLYYKDHDINEMAQGNAGFHATLYEIHLLLTSQFVNPDLPRLQLPKAKYGHLSPDTFLPKNNWRTLFTDANPGQLWFNDPMV